MSTYFYHCPECGFFEEIDCDESGSSECPECGCDWACEWDIVKCGDCGSDNMEWEDERGWHCEDCGSYPEEVHFYQDDDD